MIVVTGAAGFIGSCMVRKLNDEGHEKEILVVDDFYNCLLYTSPSPRDQRGSRMPSSA